MSRRQSSRQPRPPLRDRVMVRMAGTATTVGALVAIVEAGRKWR